MIINLNQKPIETSDIPKLQLNYSLSKVPYYKELENVSGSRSSKIYPYSFIRANLLAYSFSGQQMNIIQSNQNQIQQINLS